TIDLRCRKMAPPVGGLCSAPPGNSEHERLDEGRSRIGGASPLSARVLGTAKLRYDCRPRRCSCCASPTSAGGCTNDAQADGRDRPYCTCVCSGETSSVGAQRRCAFAAAICRGELASLPRHRSPGRPRGELTG